MDSPTIWYQDLPLWNRVRQMVRRYLLVLRPWEVPEMAQQPGGGVAYGLAERLLGRGWTPQMLTALADIEHELDELRHVLPETLSPRSARIWRRWRELVGACGLDPWEDDALALLTCAELVPEVQKWFQISLAQPRESLPYHFLKGLIDPQGERAVEVEHTLSGSGSLARFQLIHQIDRQTNMALSEEGGYRVAPAVLAFLRELPRGIESPVAPAVGFDMAPLRALSGSPETGGHGLPTPWLPALDVIGWENTATVIERVALAETNGKHLVVFAPRGWGALTVARHMARKRGTPVLHFDFGKLPERTPPEVALGVVRREARLSGATLYIDGVETLPQGTAESLARVTRMLGSLEGEPYPRVLRLGLSVSRALSNHLIEGAGGLPVTLPSLDPDARRDLWRRALEHHEIDIGDSLVFLVRAYNLGVEQIDRAALLALGLARRRALDAPQVTLADLQAACRQQSDHALRQIATAVTVSATWDDVVLDEDTVEAIREIVLFGKHQRKVLDTWGYGRSMSYGRALTALFSGPSGTGKTMMAGLIAQELGCELYRADLSQLVSKYIGETEERLSHLFDEADATGAALFFDEADSLFGKRTEVKSSTDRYANLEVNYLLQRIEQFSGVVILATNFAKSIDDAFQRRIRFKIEFHKPDEDQRLALWSVMIPRDAPREDELGLSRLADRFDLTGGEIRNAVIRAAMYAADGDRPLSFQHLVKAVEQEYRNTGRLVPHITY